MTGYALVLIRSGAQVTKEWLIASFEVPWLKPADGSSYIYRMELLMVPTNTVPCIMHGQIRVTPRVLSIIWFAFVGMACFHKFSRRRAIPVSPPVF